MFHVPVNIYFNLDSAVFDAILLFFLERQYGNTSPHSKAFRTWLLSTIFASIADVPLRIIYTTYSIRPVTRCICFAMDFLIMEAAMVTMFRYSYLYYKEKKNTGSKVLILAAFHEECGVKVHASQNEKAELVFVVADTGIGIKKEDFPYLFAKYRRFDNQKNKHIQGTGLGLSIVSSLVNRMNGHIEVESVYGNGSKFTVSLPLAEGNKLSLKRGSFLDTTAGLSYFGESIGDYRAALNIFLDHASQLEQELKGLYGQPAIDVYNICHPLAYFALNIGAMELADRAFKNQRGDNPKQTMDEVIPVFNETVYRVREYVAGSKFM